MDWDKDLSDKAKEWMKTLGNFSPTVQAKSREVKGCMLGDDGESGKVYFDARELIELSNACKEVALWLNARANNASS